MILDECDYTGIKKEHRCMDNPKSQADAGEEAYYLATIILGLLCKEDGTRARRWIDILEPAWRAASEKPLACNAANQALERLMALLAAAEMASQPVSPPPSPGDGPHHHHHPEWLRAVIDGGRREKDR
ncbi:hypothetical protein [Methylogaea oryzae]|uniref:Uncharacterized protein n=1 Tax=Methylogaea oryzae TaxID=1295382 RepID=A0A8D4VQR2_9GAMM|nr:hypothetical protein [Methylogaea oryzae]BBL72788.1 hypothetical protein MoryE10_33940 [Methylogaea oryzae]